jgi:mannose-6-phosphate isomerase-like protein (cupin superfamily)
MAAPYTHKNLNEIEDSAAKHGFGHIGEARFANSDLETEQTGISFHRLKPNARQAFGHRHEKAEEVYVVIGGSGRVKLDEEIVELGEHDVVRISPGIMRALEAGADGLEVLAVGSRRADDPGEVVMDWWSD